VSEHKPISLFQPVPVRPRHDGWTAERQIAFVEKLADSGSVSAACNRSLGLHTRGGPRSRAC
jgi:hypothetical protein